MYRRFAVLVLMLLLAAFAVPTAAQARPYHGDDQEETWEDWRPGLPEDAQEIAEDEVEPPADTPAPEDPAPWFEDLEDSGDEEEDLPPAPATTRKRRLPKGKGAPLAAGLRGVRYRSLIIRYARMRRLEPALVAAVIHAESAFNPRAVSRVGARGLMQLMPATARGMGARVSRLFDPATNISFGTLYLSRVRAMVGSRVSLMAAAYNAGPGAVRKHGGIPPYAETRTYVKRVAALRVAYAKR